MDDTAKPKSEDKAKALARVQTSVCGLVLNTLEDMKTVAQLILQSGLAPDSFKTAEQIFVGLQTGAELGLKPMQSLNSIVVIKGKPTLWGDAALALVKRSGLLFSFSEEVTGEGDDMIAVVKSVRLAGEGKAPNCMVESTFSVADAKTAKLWKKQGPWTTHPKRMLKYKARAFNLRDNFPDVLFGLHLTEEMYGEEPLPAPESDVKPRDERRMAVPSTTVDTTRAPADKTMEDIKAAAAKGHYTDSREKLTPESIKNIEAAADGEAVAVEAKEDKPESVLAAVPFLEAVAETVKNKKEEKPCPDDCECDRCKDEKAEEQRLKNKLKSQEPAEKPKAIDVIAKVAKGQIEEKYGSVANAITEECGTESELVVFVCKECGQTYQYGKEEGKGVPCECGKGLLVEWEKQPEPAEPAGDEDKKPEDAKTLYMEVNGMYVVQGGKDFFEFAAYVLLLDESEVSPSKLTEEQLKQIKAYIETSGVAIG